MPDAINQAFVTQYRDTLHMQVQQMGSRLLGTVRIEPITGEAAYIDRLGAFTANEYADREANGVRHQDTPVNDTPHSKRLVTPVDFDWGTLVDHFDKIRMLIDPMSAYNVNARAAIGRKIDQRIIAGAIADAVDKGGNAIEFPSGNNHPTAEDGVLDMALILEMERRLNAVEADGTDRFWLVNSTRWAQLKNIPEVKSADFNQTKVLAGNGAVDPFSIHFNGFQFIRSELGATPLGGADVDLVWQKQGIVYGDWTDVIAEIAKDPTKKYSWRPYYCQTGGATRMEEELVYTVTYTNES